MFEEGKFRYQKITVIKTGKNSFSYIILQWTGGPKFLLVMPETQKTQTREVQIKYLWGGNQNKNKTPNHKFSRKIVQPLD